MPRRRVNARNVNAMNANAALPIPDQEVSNVELRNAIQMLAKRMTHQNNRVHDPINENIGKAIARVRILYTRW